MRALFSCSVLLVTSLSVFACSGGDSGLDVNQDGSAAGTGAVGSGAVSGGGSGGTLSGTGASAGTGATAGTGGVVSGTGATGGTGGQATEIVCTSTCTDTPRDTESCQQAQEWGFCSEDWFAGYCEETCGTCSGEEVCMEVPVTGEPVEAVAEATQARAALAERRPSTPYPETRRTAGLLGTGTAASLIAPGRRTPLGVP